ncbi:MAG TPA: ABC transporter substrate-binding protein [Deltaproteobacteria bacterium]|nr:ABC transporter substrate-binding protein [Deltaproteobacteria bacterium]
MIKSFISLLTTVFIAGLLSMTLAISGAAAQVIKIGAVLPTAEISGQDAARAMQLAVKEINAAGGLLGNQVELIVENEAMTPEKAAEAVEKLVNMDKVDVIVGGTSNEITMEAIPALIKYEKVTVWMGASSRKVEDALEGQDWFFHIHAWDYQIGAYKERMWRQIVQKYPSVKRKKIFVAYKEDPFGSDSFSVGKPVADAYRNIMQGEAYASTETEEGGIKSILSTAKDFFEPDIFIWNGPEKDAVVVLEAAKEVGFAPPAYVGKTLLWPAGFGKQLGSEGILFYSYWHEAVKNRNRTSAAFVNAFRKEYNEAPQTYFGPLGYTNIMIVADGIKRAGSLERDALMRALAATEYESPLGDTLSFRRSLGIKHQSGANLKLMQWQGGEVKVIWPWELATAKLIYPFPAQGFTK